MKYFLFFALMQLACHAQEPRQTIVNHIIEHVQEITPEMARSFLATRPDTAVMLNEALMSRVDYDDILEGKASTPQETACNNGQPYTKYYMVPCVPERYRHLMALINETFAHADVFSAWLTRLKANDCSRNETYFRILIAGEAINEPIVTTHNYSSVKTKWQL